MAISAGEIEATLKLKDELTAQLRQATDKLKGFGVEAGKQQAGPLKDFQSRINNLKAELGPLGPVMAGAFSAVAVVNFARASMAAAANIGDLAESTRIGAAELQKLQYVFAGSPTTINEVAKSMDNLSRAVASGEASDQLERIGFSTKDLINQKPEQMFFAVAEAIGKIENPAKQAQLRFELLGKAAGEMSTETLRKISGEFSSAPALMTDTTVAMADAWDAGWARFTIRAKAGAANTMVAIARSMGSGLAMDPELASLMSQDERALAAFNRGKKAKDIDSVSGLTFPPEWAMFSRGTAVPGAPKDADVKKLEADIASITKLRAEDHAMMDKVRASARAYFDEELDRQHELFLAHEAIARQRQQEIVDLRTIQGINHSSLAMLPGKQFLMSGPQTTVGIDSATQDKLGSSIAQSLTKPPQKAISDSWKKYFSSDFGNVIVAAAAGGGNKWQAIGASIGNQIGSSLNEKLAKKMGSGILGSLGSGLASMGIGLGLQYLFSLLSDNSSGSGMQATGPYAGDVQAQPIPSQQGPKVIVVHINDDKRRVLSQIRQDIRHNEDGIRTDLQYDLGVR